MDLRKDGKVRGAIILLLLLVMAAGSMPARADGGGEDGELPEILQNARFDQRLGEPVPLDLHFRNEQGEMIALSEYIGEKPVILSLNYYECPNLCPLVLDGLLKGMKEVPFTIGDEFNVVTVSIDPRETPPLAAATQTRYLTQYGRDGAEEGWHFLTSDQETIERLAEAVGFNYEYDPHRDQYAHPSGVIVLTPEAKIARYIYGIEFSPRDLRLALVEASENKIGSPVDQVLLFCYRYDPETGKYTTFAVNSMQLGGLVTVLGIGIFLAVMGRQELRQRHRNEGTE